MGKLTICENKGADQFRSNTDSTFPPFFKFLACFCDRAGRFVSDLVGTRIVGFLTHRLI